MVEISFSFNDVEIVGFDEVKTSSWLKYVLSDLGFDSAELDYVFVDNNYLLKMNQDFLKHDYYTDIITFNYNEGNSLCGEMYISVDMIASNAKEYSDSNFENELYRVVVHGLLHLAGYDDKTESEKMTMRAKEDYYLNQYNVSRET